jgi:hypothetical protein
VEGITDRLVISSLLDGVAALFGNNEAIEIVEVGGKNNFADYQALLAALETRCYVVADRDYLSEVGNANVRRLFEVDYEKQWRVLTQDKKSMDAAAMARLLREAVLREDLREVAKFSDYLATRHTRLRQELSVEDREAINEAINELAAKHVYVLSGGEIENYLPAGAVDVRSIVSTVSTREWINAVPTASLRSELLAIVCAVLGVSAKDRELLLQNAAAGRVAFPKPLAEPVSGAHGKGK